HRIVLDHHSAEVVRPWHGVIHERASEYLSGLVIGFVLHQHLTHALRDATHDLALDQHRVDHGADVVHHPIADHLRAAGLGIDLTLANGASWRRINKLLILLQLCRYRGVGVARRVAARHSRSVPGRSMGSTVIFFAELSPWRPRALYLAVEGGANLLQECLAGLLYCPPGRGRP